MKSDPEAAVLLRGIGGQVAGPDRLRLLRAVRDHGSIAAAARSVGLSYKAAWDAIDTMNNLFAKPLVAGRSGGSKGGGTSLTPQGEEVLEALSGAEAALSRFVAALNQELHTGSTSQSAIQLWRFAMKVSARNVLAGTISSVTKGAVNAEVGLKIGSATELVAIITNESVDTLGLEPGGEALAVIKSSFVILMPGNDPVTVSARNIIPGTISRRDDGSVNSELVLDIGDEKTLTAIITKASADHLGLHVGSPATALVKASHIILMAP